MTTVLDLTAYRAHLTRRLEERGVPEHLHRGLLAYFTERQRPGSFLYGVLADTLSGAVLRADEASLPALNGLVRFLVNHAPFKAWGSPEKVQAWLAETGPVPMVVE